MTHYKIGDKVAAKKFGPLEHDFSGEVEKVYDNSVMIAITEYDPADQSGINELKEVPRTKEDLEAAAKEEEEAAAKAAKSGKNTRRRRTKTTKESASSEKNEKSSK